METLELSMPGNRGRIRRTRLNGAHAGRKTGLGQAVGGGAKRLALVTWPEVERYLARSGGILLPMGFTERHGPIGTDALCIETIADRAAASASARTLPDRPTGRNSWN